MQCHRLTTAAVALLLALGAGVLEGQAVDSLERRVQTEYPDTILTLRPPRSGFAAPEPTGFLELAEAGKRATVSGGWRLPRPGWPNLNAIVEASTPLDEGDSPVSFGGHSGLSSGTTIKLSLTGTRWTLPSEKPGAMSRWCVDTQKRARAESDEKTLRGIDCTFPAGMEDSLTKEQYTRYLRETRWTEPWIFDVNVGVGRTRFDYMDATTFATGSDEKYGWTAGADVGRYQGRTLLSAGVHYKVEHRAGSEAEICLPVGGAGALRCRTSALGAPARTESWTADAQMRRFFGPRGRFGVNPVVEVDLRETELVARLPIYFLANDSGALVGGITPSYSSHGEEHWAQDVFLGLKAPLAFGPR